MRENNRLYENITKIYRQPQFSFLGLNEPYRSP